MKIVLLSDVANLGKKDDIVEAKNGYASFLINSKKAIAFSSGSKKILQEQQSVRLQNYQEEVAQAQELAKQIDAITLHFSLKTNEHQTFGSISNKTIAAKLLELYQIKLPKYSLIEQTTNYKIGLHKIKIKLHKDVIAVLKVAVEAK